MSNTAELANKLHDIANRLILLEGMLNDVDTTLPDPEGSLDGALRRLHLAVSILEVRLYEVVE